MLQGDLHGVRDLVESHMQPLVPAYLQKKIAEQNCLTSHPPQIGGSVYMDASNLHFMSFYLDDIISTCMQVFL